MVGEGHSDNTARLAARTRSSGVVAKEPHLLAAGVRKDPAEDNILDATAHATASAAVAVDTGDAASDRMSAAVADVGAGAGADAGVNADAGEVGEGYIAVIAVGGHIVVVEGRIVAVAGEGNTQSSRGLGWGLESESAPCHCH